MVVFFFFVYPNTHICLAFYPTRSEREKDKAEAFVGHVYSVYVFYVGGFGSFLGRVCWSNRLYPRFWGPGDFREKEDRL